MFIIEVISVNLNRKDYIDLVTNKEFIRSGIEDELLAKKNIKIVDNKNWTDIGEFSIRKQDKGQTSGSLFTEEEASRLEKYFTDLFKKYLGKNMVCHICVYRDKTKKHSYK